MNWLLVAAGGASGAVLRYALARGVGAVAGLYPLGTQLANVTGSLAIGVLFAWITERWGSDHPAHALLLVGLLGGFTTFSSFSLETVRLIEQDRIVLALSYAVSSAALCVAAAGLGLWLGRRLV